MDRDDHDPKEQARSKAFKNGNVGPDGDYLVGKNRPPKNGQFAASDGRKRGRRPKGQKNFDTEFAEEARRQITVRENGKERRVSKLRSTIVRAFDNAGSKGQNQAIATIFNHSARMAEKSAQPAQGLTADEDALVEAWIAQRLASVAEGDPLGDPERATSEASRAGPSKHEDQSGNE